MSYSVCCSTMKRNRILGVITISIVMLIVYIGLSVAEAPIQYEESTGAVLYSGCTKSYGSQWESIQKPWIDGEIYEWCHNTATGQDLLMGE